jgi:signal peptide peptidase SppA
MQIKYNSIWAIDPSYLQQIADYEFTVNEQKINEYKEAVKKFTSLKNTEGGIAVLPLKGMIENKRSLWTDLFGTSCEEFAQWFDSSINNPDIGAIVIDVDSGGGTTGGVEELSNKIYASRNKKPIIAVIDDYDCSAAYHISSAADQIVITPSGFVGSVGVYAVHKDISEAAQKAGIKYTFIQAGKYKTEGNPVEPLKDEARDYIQKQVDEIYEKFVNNIARNRGTTSAKVKKYYGEGRILSAKDSLEVGMVDRIGTMEEVLKYLTPKTNKKSTINKMKMEILRR